MCFSKGVRFVVAQFIARCVSPEFYTVPIGQNHLESAFSVSSAPSAIQTINSTHSPRTFLTTEN